MAKVLQYMIAGANYPKERTKGIIMALNETIRVDEADAQALLACAVDVGQPVFTVSNSRNPTYDVASEGVLSKSTRVAVTVTRPANVTAYGANDAVGGVITLPGVGRPGGLLTLVSASLTYYVAAIPASMTTFRLHLYSSTPPSALADNAAFDLPAGDRSVHLGSVTLPASVDFGATLMSQLDNIQKVVPVGPAGSLFAYLVTTAGWTPAANSEVMELAIAGFFE